MRNKDRSPKKFDAVVVGGGPAGSTAANLLAQKGRRVLLLEKERFPRHHIGESLLPGLNYLYARLGVSRALKEAGFFVKTGGSYVWGKGRRPWSVNFVNAREDRFCSIPVEETSAYHVDRAFFDQLLLEHSARRGARVEQPARVRELSLRGERVLGVDYETADGRLRRAEAEFYLDASGQSALISRRLGWQLFDEQLRHMAVYTYFRGGRRLPGARANHIFVVNERDGWFWYIPLVGGRFSVGFVTSIDRAKEVGRDPEAFLTARIRASRPISRLLGRAERAEPLRLLRDWSYRGRRFAGDNFLLVGDAAAFIDPLLSYGVTLAMHSAALAADCVDLALRAPSRRGEILAHYGKQHAERFDQLLDFVKYFYDGNRHRGDYFWKARRIARPLDNRYAKYAFTYLVAGYPIWNNECRTYFDRFFTPLGAPVGEMRRDARFLESVSRLQSVELALIDESFAPPPGLPDERGRRWAALAKAAPPQERDDGP